MSYRGGFHVGLNVDTGAVEHPGDLRTEIEAGFAEVFEAAGV
jgi:hypothetical protein